MSNPIEGWYPDPEGTPRLRWWDGTGWTDDYRTEASYDAPSPNVSRFAPTIDPVTGTTSHPITGIIDPFTGSVARPVTSTSRFAPTIDPVTGTASHPITASVDPITGTASHPITASVDPITGRVLRPGEEADAPGHATPDVPPAGAEPTTAQSRRPAQGTPQPPKSQVVIAVITTILTIGFAAGATMTVSMYRAASAEFQQAEKALSDANSDLSAAQEAAQ